MVRSIRSPYESELDSGHNPGGVETYRVERTEIITHGGSTHDGHAEHLAHSSSHGSTTHAHSTHGHSTHGLGHGGGKNSNLHQHRLGENAVPALVQAFSGAIGASIANLAVHPLDLIIKRLQVQRQIEMQRRTQMERRAGVSGSGSGGGGRHQSTTTEHTSHFTSPPSRSRGQSPEHVVLGMDHGDQGRVRTEGREHTHSFSETHFSTTTIEGGFVEHTYKSEEFEMEGHYSGVIDAAQKIWAQEGLGGFYTGVVEETVGTLGGAFWYFAVYSYLRSKRLKKRHSPGLPVLEELLIGLAAGSVSKFFLTPFNTVATRKQTHAMLYPNAKSTGIVTIYHDIMREKGITGFWSGYSASAFLSLNPSITFLLYESLKGFAGGKRRRLKGAETFLLAAVAKAIATGMTYPLAVARSRAQITNESDFDIGNLTSIGKVGNEVKKAVSRKARRGGNVIEILVDIFKREGIAGLYEGVLGEILRGFVSSGITMVIKESVHRTILSLYYFVMRAYNRSGDHTFQSTTKLMAKDAYNKAGPRQKKFMNKAIEGVEKVTSSASHGKAKVVGLVGASQAAHKLSEVREKISETTGIGKHRRESSTHKGVKVAAATAAVAGIAAGAIHAHKRNKRQDEHGGAIAHTAHERNERYDEHGNIIVHTANERNDRYDEHGNVIVHTARERVEEWREGVDDERIHAAKVSHSHSHSGHVVDDRIHNGQVSHSHSGHVLDDRIHTGEMRQEVVETRTHSASGGVGSRIGRHNSVTEHTRIEERVQHGNSGSGSHSRRGSAVTAAALAHKHSSHSKNEHSHTNNAGHGTHGGIVGAVTGAAHKITGHSHNEHTHSGHGNQGGLVGTVAGATLGHKLSSHSHSHTEHGHSSGHGGLASGAIGAVAGAALGHKLSSHSHNEHTHSSHGNHSGLVNTVAGATLGHKLSSHSHNEHTHGSHGNHGGLVGTVAGATLGHKLSSHSHNEHTHSSHGNQSGLVNTVAGAALGHKLSSHSHNEHTHGSHGNHGGIVGAVTGAAHKLTGHNEHSHSSHGNHGGLVNTVAGAALGHKLSSHSHSHTEHGHNSGHGGHGGLASGAIGAVAGAVLANKLSSHSHNEHTHSSSHSGLVNSHGHNEHSHSNSGHAGLASGAIGAVTGAVLGNKLSSHNHNSSGSGVGLASGVVGAVTGAVLGNKLSGHSHSHTEHSHSNNNHGGIVSGVVSAVTGAAHKLTGHSHNEHTQSSHGSHGKHGSLVSTAAAATLGHKLSSHTSHGHTEHGHSSSHGGLASGAVGAVAGAVLGHKISSHSHNEHTHSSHGNHGGLVSTVAGATLGHKISSHNHNEHTHSSHGNHGGLVSTVAGATLGHKLSSNSYNEQGHSHSGRTHSHHGGDVVTQTTTKIVEEFGIMKDPRTPLMHDHHENHQAVANSRARFGENSHHEHTSVHESRGREHGAMSSAVTGAVERIVGHGNNTHGRPQAGARHNSSDLVQRTTGSHSHGHGHSAHGHDGQTIIRTTETVNQWRDEANAVEDLRQFGVASTVNEDSRSDFGETLHKGHSIVGHGHSSRFGDDAVVHGGHGHTVIEKTQITRVGETLHDGGHHTHSHGSHGHRHSESRSNFGDAALHTDGRTIIEKTQVTRIGETLHDGGHHSQSKSHGYNDSALHTDGRTIVEKTEVTRIGGTTHNAHSHNAIPTQSPLGRFEDAAINKVVEKTQITRFGQDTGHQQHHSHSSHSHGHNNGVAVGNVGNDNTITRTTVRETEWLGKKALVNNSASLASINTAAATTGSNNFTTVTRTEEFWPVDEDARSSVYNFLDEETKEVGGVKIETKASGGRWWSDKRGKGYN